MRYEVKKTFCLFGAYLPFEASAKEGPAYSAYDNTQHKL